jgi:hypothetical protein
MLCDSVFIVFGNLKEETDPGKLFVANFCLSEQARSIAYLFPHQPTDKAIFEFAITVDSLESISKIDFFGDILTRPVEEEVESSMQRLLWPNSMEFYQQRMEENQLLE